MEVSRCGGVEGRCQAISPLPYFLIFSLLSSLTLLWTTTFLLRPRAKVWEADALQRDFPRRTRSPSCVVFVHPRLSRLT